MRHQRGEARRKKARAIQCPFPCPFALRCRRAGRGIGSARYGARSPSGASPRRLPERANAPAQPRPRFPRAGGRGRYPRRHSRLSEAPRTPVIMPAGTIPGPPGSGVTNPARGNRISLRYQDRLSSNVPSVSETGRGYGDRRRKVKGFRVVPMRRGFLSSASLLKECVSRLIRWLTKLNLPLAARGGGNAMVLKVGHAYRYYSRESCNLSLYSY